MNIFKLFTKHIAKKISFWIKGTNIWVFLIEIPKYLIKDIKKNAQISRKKCLTSIIFTAASVLYTILLKGFNLHHGRAENQVSITKEMGKIIKYSPILWLNENVGIWDVGFLCESENISHGMSYFNRSISISLCFFSRSMSFSGNGGVINIDGGLYSMIIEYSMFYNCTSSLQGGAIYFNSSHSDINMVCANRCSCGYNMNFQFSYLRASQMNHLEYISVSYCSPSISGNYPLCLKSGNQRVENLNSSMNNAKICSGLCTSSPSSFSCSYCTFSNNYAYALGCINVISSSGTITIAFTNIVHNNSPSYGVVLTYDTGIKIMMYCIFHKNRDTLFSVEYGLLQVIHSFIDHSSQFSIYSSLDTATNNSFISKTTYEIQFFNSYHCNAEIPLPQRTNQVTHKETMPRTYEDCIITFQAVNKREIYVIFSFFSLSYLQ